MCVGANTFDPGSATLLDTVPTTGTFYSMRDGGPPWPFDPFPDLPVYSDGVSGEYWINDVDYERHGFTSDDGSPTLTGFGGTNGDSGGVSFPTNAFTLTTNLWQYTNFWLTISNVPTNAAMRQVTAVSTLPGFYYSILTNSDLTTTNWGVWTTLLATSSNTPAPPIVTSNQLFFRGMISHGSYITNGLLAYWKLHETNGSSAADSSGNVYTATLTNSPSWGTNCLILSGSDQFGYASPANTATVFTNHDLTLCARIKQSTQNTGEVGIIDKTEYNGLASTGWGFWIQTNGHLEFLTSEHMSDPGPSSVEVGDWMFVAAVWHYSSNAVDFYINGAFNGTSSSGTSAIQATPPTTSVLIGNLTENLSHGDYAFKGSIRDVAIYSRALTASEIRQNVLLTSDNFTYGKPDLLYYKMKEFNPGGMTYPFNLTDSSLNGGTTGVYGPSMKSETWQTNNAGISNAALHFSGNNSTSPGDMTGTYVDTQNTNLFTFTGAFTMNLWVNVYGDSGYIAGCESHTTGITNGWHLVDAGNHIYFGSGPDSTNHIFTGNLGLANVYKMVTVTGDGVSRPVIYVNGLPVSTSGDIGPIFAGTNSLKLALETDPNFYLLDGNIWLFQIWSYQTPALGILDLYSNQVAGSPYP